MSLPKHPDLKQGRPNHAMRPVGSTTVANYDVPSPPDTLSELTKEIWSALWQYGQGAYHPTGDYLVIKRYCEYLDRRQMFLDHLEKGGLDAWISTGSKGNEMPSAIARQLATTEESLDKLERLLGLTPEARIRLMIGGAKAVSELDEFRQTLIDDEE